MKKVFLFVLTLALLLVVPIMPVTPVSAVTNLTVDLSDVIGPVTHCATGSLYGVVENKPSDNFLAQIRPKVLTNPAVAGYQYQQPWGAAIPVAQRVAQYGTKVQIRLADWFPGWYDFTNLQDYFNKMTTTVNAVKAAGLTNVYGYEIWNEPYYTWKPDKNGMTFDEFYSLAHAKLKELDPNAKAIGPSWEWYDHNAMKGFLTYQKARNTIPDIICWHQLNNEDFTRDYLDYRALEQSLGISPRPITINEYSGKAWLSDEGRPGAVAPIIAKFERFRIDSACQSYWDVPNPGRLGSLLATDTQPNGGFWFYKWYADMSGNMVNTIPPNPSDMYAVDAFACVDSSQRYASILFGGVTDGSINVVIRNIPSWFGEYVNVRVDWTPFVNRSTVVNSTNVKLQGSYAVTNGQITVPIAGLYNNDGYRIYLTPGTGGGTSGRYEAEHAVRSNCNVFNSSNASNGQYVGQIDYSDSYVDFNVNVPSAGTYNMAIRYANGTGANSTHGLAYNGGPWSTVTYPPTGGWAQFATINVSVNLNAGANIIRLAKGSPYFEGGVGYAELDYIELTPLSGGGGDYYQLRNVATNMYADGLGRTGNGSNCGQYANTTHHNSQWEFIHVGGNYYKLKNRGTGLYLDGMGRTANGSICGQWQESSSYNQQWEQISVGNYFKFRNRATGLYLDGMGYTSNGADLCQWSDSSSNNQRWVKIAR